MKKSIYTIFTLCLGVVIGMTTTVAAEPVGEYVRASFQKVVFIVNGEEKPLDADPLVYQGSTYLPVRTVLNALGYDVGYKSDTKTVTADKSIDAIMLELTSLTSDGGEAMGTTTNVDEQINSLQKSIESASDVVNNLNIAIEQIKNDSSLDEKQKEEKISSYKSRVDDFTKRIKSYEEKLLELQK